MAMRSWRSASRERIFREMLKDQVWSIACSDLSWEGPLCGRLEEFLAGDESIHVVRFARTDTGELRVSTWVDAPARPTEVPAQRGSVLDDPRRHPGVQALIDHGTSSPIRLSDVADLPRFRHTEIFQRMQAYPQGTRFASAATLRCTARELVLVGCHSTRKDLSIEHMEMLARLQRVLSSALVIRRELSRLAMRDGGSAPESGAVATARGGQLLRLPLPAPPQTDADYWPTPREQQVLGLLTLGLTSRQIARRMEITERTVRKHLESVYRKAELPSRVAAAAWWQRRSG